jgi:hypothetical protein
MIGAGFVGQQVFALHEGGAAICAQGRQESLAERVVDQGQVLPRREFGHRDDIEREVQHHHIDNAEGGVDAVDLLKFLEPHFFGRF